MTHYCLNKYNSNGNATKVTSGDTVGGLFNRENGQMGSGNTGYAWASNKDNEISINTLNDQSPTLYYGHKYRMHVYTDDTSIGHDNVFSISGSYGVFSDEISPYEDTSHSNVLAYYFYIRPKYTNSRIYADIHAGVSGNTERHKDVYTFRATSSQLYFLGNGGTLASSTPNSVELKDGVYTVPLPSYPKRDGYVFGGWYSNNSGTGGINFGKTGSINTADLLTNDLIRADGKCNIYAKWDPLPECTLTIHITPAGAPVSRRVGTSTTSYDVADGDTISSKQGYRYIASQKEIRILDDAGNESYHLIAKDATGDTNYTFQKWTQTINGVTSDVSTENYTTISTSAITFTAVFSGSYKFTISTTSNNEKIANGGFQITDKTNIYVDSTCTSPASINTTYSSDTEFYVPISSNNSIRIKWPSGHIGTTDGTSPYYYTSNDITTVIYNSHTGSSESESTIISGGTYLRPYNLVSSTTYYKKINYYNNTSNADTSAYTDVVSSTIPQVSFTTHNSTGQSYKTGYTFDGWALSRNGSISYQKNTTYTSIYSSGPLDLYAHWTINTYTITWVNYDGTQLKTSTSSYGETPIYDGPTPTKPPDVQYTYYFDGWSPDVVPTTENKTYTAKYTTSSNVYTITVEVGSYASGGGSVDPVGTKQYGHDCQYVVLTATPNEGNKFAKWKRNGADIPSGGSIDPTSPKITVDLSYYDGSIFTAIFEELPDITYIWHILSNEDLHEDQLQYAVNSVPLYDGTRISEELWTSKGTSKPIAPTNPIFIMGQTYYCELRNPSHRPISEAYIYGSSECDVSFVYSPIGYETIVVAITPKINTSLTECYVQVILKTTTDTDYSGYGYVVHISNTGYSCTLNANGGTFSGLRTTTVKCPINSILRLPSEGHEIFSPDGRSLNCWKTGDDVIVPYDFSSDTASDYTLYAQWGTTYTLHFATNGHGYFSGNISGTSYDKEVGSSMYYLESDEDVMYIKHLQTESVYLEADAKPYTYYNFHHWDYILGEVTGNRTITAYFYPKLGLYYMANDGSSTAWKEDIYSEGAESHNFTITNEIPPSHTGDTLLGWGSSKYDVTPTYFAGDTITIDTSDPIVYLFAIWGTIGSYSLTFDVNGGTGNIPSMTGTSTDGYISFLLNVQTIPTKSGKTFVGWAWMQDAITPDFVYKNNIFNPAYVTLYHSNPIRKLYAVYQSIPTDWPYEKQDGRLVVFDAQTMSYRPVDDASYVIVLIPNGGHFNAEYISSGQLPEILVTKCEHKAINGEMEDVTSNLPIQGYYKTKEKCKMYYLKDQDIFIWALFYEDCTKLTVSISNLPFALDKISAPIGFDSIEKWEMIAPYNKFEPEDGASGTYDVILDRATVDNVRQVTISPFWTPSRDGNLRAIAVASGLGSLDFGAIQGISTTYTSKLTVAPIVCYGYTGTFCMDLGVTKAVALSYIRVSPETPDNDSYDSRLWDNAHWVKRLREFTDRWQMRTNGCVLYLKRPNLKRLTNDESTNDPMEQFIGEINGENCYITSTPVRYVVGKPRIMEGTVSFTMGTLYPKQTPLDMVQVTFVWGEKEVDRIADRTLYIQYPKDTAAIAPSIPYVWTPILNGETYKYVTGLYYYNGPKKEPLTAGTYFTPTEGMTIYGDVNTIEGSNMKFYGDSPDTMSGMDIISGDGSGNDIIVTYFMIGGGGGGGGGSCKNEGGGTLMFPYWVGSGGAGGESGYYRTETIIKTPGTYTVTYSVGTGGNGGSGNANGGSASKGDDGIETTLTIEGLPTYIAPGGIGGPGASNQSSAGIWTNYTPSSEAFVGGNGGSGSVDGANDGDNGKCANSVDDPNCGLGGKAEYTKLGVWRYVGGGGGGGGAPVISGWTDDSRGGSGQKLPDNTVAYGTYGSGGGGGSGHGGDSEGVARLVGGKGGNGAILVVIRNGTIKSSNNQ